MNAPFDMIYPRKKGKLAKDPDQNLVLINPDGEVYSTNEDLVATWQLCDGRSPLKEIERKAMKSEDTSDNIDENFSSLLQRLASVNLVDLVPKSSM